MPLTCRTPITLTDLKKIPKPEATDSYAPVPHIKVVEMTLEQLEKSGFKVLSAAYHIARKGDQARGDYEIETKDKDMNIQMAWMNSYDKTIPLRWALGGHVIICGNGMVVGDMGIFK